MTRLLSKYITISPEILGGTPVIAGTRIPVERIYQLIKHGDSVETLQKQYSWVDKAKIQNTIAYLMKAGLNEYEKTQKVQATTG
jgi:uncharacterized protein (DUF433 family)